jgi:hypothetical protein
MLKTTYVKDISLIASLAYFKALCGTFNILRIYRYRPNRNNGLNRLKMACFEWDKKGDGITHPQTSRNEKKE